MMIHELKCHPEPFTALWDGRKTYEVREDDRGFQVGDTLWLRCWDPVLQLYLGNEIYATVEYLTAKGTWGLPANLCVMSVKVIRREFKR